MLPLNAHPVLRATRMSELAGFVETGLNASVRSSGAGASCSAAANGLSLPHGSLWVCAYGRPLTLGFGDSDYVRVQVGLRGAGETRLGRRQVPVTSQAGCVSPAEADVAFGQDFEQLVWRVPVEFLVRTLAALGGQPVVGRLVLEPALDLATPTGRRISIILGSLAAAADLPQIPAAALIFGELEQALALSVLSSCCQSHRHLVDRTPPRAAPWQVRRAEAYLEANWDRPFSIDDLAAAVGTSIRTLFRTFRAHRGCSPSSFLRRLRLDHARALLAGAQDPSLTVTEVALRCGFGDLGQFTREFRSAYGEPPSAVLNRSRAPSDATRP